MKKKEALAMLLEKYLTKGEPLLIVGLDDERVPDIHNFYPKQYYPSIQHLGFGFFEGQTEHGKFSFDAGGAMHHLELEDGWISYSLLRTDNEQVLKDLGYDVEKVSETIREVIEKI